MHEIDPEVSEPACVAEPLTHALRAGFIYPGGYPVPVRCGTVDKSILGMAAFHNWRIVRSDE